MPKISVIVPAYKVEAYLDRCVQSILNQSFTDFELILIDDGSPDNCPAMCDEYAKQDERVVVLHQQNSGLSAARNAGIDWAFANSDSEWLTFIDSDDWIHEEYLECLYRAAVDNQVAISVCGFERTEEINPHVNKIDGTSILWSSEDFYVTHSTNAVVAWGKLYQKKLFRNIRYPVGKIHEDEFTTHRLLFQCPRIIVVHYALYYYYINNESIMGKRNAIKEIDTFEAYEEKLHFFKKNHFKRACVYQLQLSTRTYYRVLMDLYALGENEKHRERIARIKKGIRRLLIRNHLPIKKHVHLYEEVFPKWMKSYWFLSAVKNKVVAFFK